MGRLWSGAPSCPPRSSGLGSTYGAWSRTVMPSPAPTPCPFSRAPDHHPYALRAQGRGLDSPRMPPVPRGITLQAPLTRPEPRASSLLDLDCFTRRRPFLGEPPLTAPLPVVQSENLRALPGLLVDMTLVQGSMQPSLPQSHPDGPLLCGLCSTDCISLKKIFILIF